MQQAQAASPLHHGTDGWRRSLRTWPSSRSSPTRCHGSEHLLLTQKQIMTLTAKAAGSGAVVCLAGLLE
jgi:hypothetical protein